MKLRTLAITAGLGATLALGGCDQIKALAGGGGAPKGQVVATVDGEEITALQLRAELGNFGSRDAAVMKAAQQQALQQVILRKLLADKAREDKLDKGADYTLQVERGQETLLAQLYQRQLASKVAQPTKAETEALIASRPNQFANRKVLFVDQVIAAPNKIAPERLRPLTTLAQVRALLDAEGVRYQDNAATLDTLNADPRLVTGIMSLPAGEIFVVPQNGSLLFNQIAVSRSVPLRGEAANAYAMNMLRQQKAQEVVGKQIEAMRKAAESKIVYNEAYKPPAPKPAAKAAAPAPKTDAAPAAPAAAATTPVAK